MRAHAVVHAVDTAVGTRAARLRSEAPLLVRTAAERDGSLGLHLVGGAAGPLGGDELRTDIELGPGAVVSARSVAASLAQPSPRGEASSSAINVGVGVGAVLDWRPEPLISIAGSDHHVDVRLDVASTAHVVWLDELVLGRHGEGSGRIASRLRVTIDGAVALDHEIVAGPGAARSSGANGPFRVLASAVVVGRDHRRALPIVTATCRAAALHCADRVTLFSGVADGRDELAAAFEALGLCDPAQLTAAGRRPPPLTQTVE